MTLDEQIQAYLDGTATEADMQAVAAALRADRSVADLLAQHTLLRELLEDAYASECLVPADPLPAPSPAGSSQPVGHSRLPRLAGMIGLLCLLGIAATWGRLATMPAPQPGSTVAVVADIGPAVRWRKPNKSSPSRGMSLPAGPLAIGEGTLSLMLASGVELTIEGPAEFELHTDMHVVLHVGKLSAVVPEPAHGFLVEAQGLRVVDLGTEFEVVAPPSGQPEVAVLRGVVEASFPRSAQPLRISEAERHRFDPATGRSESLGTAARSLVPPAATDASGGQTPPAGPGLPSVGSRQLTVDTPMKVDRLDLGGPAEIHSLTLVPDGAVSVNQFHAAGPSRLHVAGGMFTLADDREDANVCQAAGTRLELVVTGGYLTSEKVVRWAANAKTEVAMELAGGLVEARRAFVLSERGSGSLLQTGGQFRIQNNLFINSQDPARATRYTIRGGSVVGRGTLRLGDWQANDGIFRIEGSQPKIHIGGLAVASDRAVLEYVLTEQGVSPIAVGQIAYLNDLGTLRIIRAENLTALPQQLVLLRYGTRRGKLAHVELDGVRGEVVYDDEAGEVRLEQIAR